MTQLSELEKFTQSRLEQMRLNLKAQEMRLQITEQFKKGNQTSFLPNAAESYEPGIVGNFSLDSGPSGLSLADPSTIVSTEAEERALFVRNMTQLIGSSKSVEIEPKFSADAVEAANTSWVQLKAALQGHFKKNPATTTTLVRYIATWLATTYGVQMAMMIPAGAVPIIPVALTPNSQAAANTAAGLVGAVPQVPTPPPAGTATPPPALAPITPPVTPPTAPVNVTTPPAMPASVAPTVNLYGNTGTQSPGGSTMTGNTAVPRYVTSSGQPINIPEAHPNAKFPLGDDVSKYTALSCVFSIQKEITLQTMVKTDKKNKVLDQLADIGVDITQDYTLVVLDGLNVINNVKQGSFVNKATVQMLIDMYFILNPNIPYGNLIGNTKHIQNVNPYRVKSSTSLTDMEQILRAFGAYEEGLRNTNFTGLTTGRGFKGKVLQKIPSSVSSKPHHGAHVMNSIRMSSSAPPPENTKKTNPNNIRLVFGGGLPNKVAIQQVTDKLIDKAQQKEASRWYIPGRPTLYLDLKALDKNQIRLKYSTSSLYKLTADITDPCRTLVQGVILRDVFDARLFASLSIQERRVIETLLQVIRKANIANYPGPMSLADLSENLTIYQGQIQAGNNDPRIKTALRDLVNEMKRLKHMSSNHAKSILDQL